MNTGRAWLGIIAFCLGATGAHAKEPPSACPSLLAGGPDTPVVNVLVDLTAWRGDVFNAGVEAAVAASIQPNRRAVLWRFGGRSQPLPQVVMDITTPRVADERPDIEGLV